MPKTGVLSDESILKNCVEYRPLPMNVADEFLGEAPQTTISGKKLKYVKQQNRPQAFNDILSRYNETVRENLEKRYAEELAKPKREVILPQRATVMNFPRRSVDGNFKPMNTNADASSVSSVTQSPSSSVVRMGDDRHTAFDDLNRRATQFLQDDYEPSEANSADYDTGDEDATEYFAVGDTLPEDAMRPETPETPQMPTEK